MTRWGSTAWLLLCGCVPRGNAEDSLFDPPRDPPVITAVAVTCDPEAGVWTLLVDTTSWSSGGTVLWTLDGEYVERHTDFRSIRAAPDGSADRLRADIALVRDFRAADDGLTAFGCRDAPSAWLWVDDLGAEPADCVKLGDDPNLLTDVSDTPACERLLEVTPEG